MKRTTKTQDSSPVRLFKTKEDWADWLENNHRKSTGLWLRLGKKVPPTLRKSRGVRQPESGLRSVSYKEALDVALCYGWIDGQKKPEDEKAWLQRFVPRSARSLWSKINREKALALIASGEMKAAGLEAIENAKKNGRWDAATIRPAERRCRMIFRLHWMRIRWQKHFSRRWIGRTGMQCFGGFRM